MKTKKRFFAMMLALALLTATLSANCFAADETRALDFAVRLKTLGLFRGVSDTDFDLQRAPTRVEAVVMLIRLLGKESDALEFDGVHPFSDVPEWADKYIAYAYENKLTNGVSATLFGSGNASANMFITFVLRALGYSDTDGDFNWENPYDLAGLLKVVRPASKLDRENFLRADAVVASYFALLAKPAPPKTIVSVDTDEKGEAIIKSEVSGKNYFTLAEKLIEEGVFTKELFDSVENNAPTADTAETAASETSAAAE